MSTYLDRILASHRAAAAADTRSHAELASRAAEAPPVRGFRRRLEAVAAGGELAVVAEVKRRSPSKGDIDARLDPAGLAAEYAEGGAACLSVLTDAEFFGGSPGDLEAARSATSLPVLRKDFTVSAADVYDARIMGADAVLLIAAALSEEELRRFHDLALALGMDALVEVHDRRELDGAVAAGAGLIGVNQRDLVTFSVDTTRAVGLAGSMPEGAVSVAESGIDGPEAAAVLAAAGYDAVLVGESLVRAPDRARAVAELRGAARVRETS